MHFMNTTRRTKEKSQKWKCIAFRKFFLYMQKIFLSSHPSCSSRAGVLELCMSTPPFSRSSPRSVYEDEDEERLFAQRQSFIDASRVVDKNLKCVRIVSVCALVGFPCAQ